MSNPGDKQLLTTAIRAVIADSATVSVIVPLEKTTRNTEPSATTSGSGSEEGSVYLGTGNATSGFNFTPQPGAFIPSELGSSSSQQPVGEGLPTGVRRIAASSNARFAVAGSNVEIALSWSAPLIDQGGRWLQGIVGVQAFDAINTYVVFRRSAGDQDAVVGVVYHNKEAITALKSFMETNALATTDLVTHKPTIAPSLFVSVTDPLTSVVRQEIQLDGFGASGVAVEAANLFTFTDTTAQLGVTYTYRIQAVNHTEQEGPAVSITPGEATGSNGLDCALGPNWATSYPLLGSGLTGVTSTADLNVTVGSRISSVEYSLIKLQSAVLTVDVSDNPDTYPKIVTIEEASRTINTPTTGTVTYLLKFIGRNIEAHGGLQTVDLHDNITYVSYTKEAIPGAAADWKYTINVTVASTVWAGIHTMTVICVDTTQASSSDILVKSTSAITPGGLGSPVFTRRYPGTLVRFTVNTSILDEFVFRLVGTDLDKITSMKVFYGNGTEDTSIIPITAIQNPGQITITSGTFLGYRKFVAQYVGGPNDLASFGVFASGRGGYTEGTSGFGTQDTGPAISVRTV